MSLNEGNPSENWLIFMKNNENVNIDNRKFLVIPNPKENEFILSYLNRLKIENGYLSLKLVIKIIFGDEIKILNLVKGNFNKSVLSNCLGINESIVDKLCLTDSDKFYLLSCILVCPYCFTEKIYIPISSYQKNVMCPIHFISYISRCPHCNKLLDWNAENIEICRFCKKYINSGIEKYVIRYEENIHQDDIYLIFNNFLKLNINSPSQNELYSLEYLSLGLQKSVDFINNPEKQILDRFRKLFIQIKVTYPNFRAVRYEFFLLVFSIVKISNEINDGTRIINCLNNIIDVNFINEILENFDQEFHCFLNNYDQSFQIREIKFSIGGICKILNLDIKILNNIMDEKILMMDENKKINFDEFIYFCKSISRNLNIENIGDNFFYLRSLHSRTQKYIFNSLLYSPFYLYNFNYDEMLLNLKINKLDLNSIIF